MTDFAEKARAYVAQGDKKLGGFSFFGGRKYEEAADLYEKAANQFKLAKQWSEAGETFMKLADLHVKHLESKHDAAGCWTEAAKAFLKVDQRQAVKCLQQAVSLYTEMGRLGMAARQLREIAEVLEKEGNKEEAIMFYEQAGDLFQTENSTSESNKCSLKIAQFSAELERYSKAIELYEEVAKASVDNNLLKYSAKGYLLNAGICQLCSADINSIRTALERYHDIDINFDGSREGKFLEDLTDAVEAGEPEQFTNVIAEYDNLSRLDPWKTTMLLRVKRKIQSRAEVEEEDLT